MNKEDVKVGMGVIYNRNIVGYVVSADPKLWGHYVKVKVLETMPLYEAGETLEANPEQLEPHPTILHIGEFLNYSIIEQKPKTVVVGVANNSGEKLGVIKWSQWRKYAFTTMPSALMFDDKCLLDIAAFVKRLNDERAQD